MNAGIDRSAADLRAARVAAATLYDLGLGIEILKKHQDWTGKKCPELILDPVKWEAFKNKVASELKTIDPPEGDAAPFLILRKPNKPGLPAQSDAPPEDVEHEKMPEEFLLDPNS